MDIHHEYYHHRCPGHHLGYFMNRGAAVDQSVVCCHSVCSRPVYDFFIFWLYFQNIFFKKNISLLLCFHLSTRGPKDLQLEVYNIFLNMVTVPLPNCPGTKLSYNQRPPWFSPLSSWWIVSTCRCADISTNGLEFEYIFEL